MRMWCLGWYLVVVNVMDLGSILDSRPEMGISNSLNTPANIRKTTRSFLTFLGDYKILFGQKANPTFHQAGFISL